jgi:flagellar motor switch protein FliG
VTQTIELVSGATKAAMFLMGIGDQVSAELLRQAFQQQVTTMVWQLQKNGSIVMSRGGGDEYVV